MKGLGGARAMELFKEVEEKKEQVRNPSGYLKSAAARENPAGIPHASPRDYPMLQRQQGTDTAKIQRRANWLNANVFPDRHINLEAPCQTLKFLALPRATLEAIEAMTALGAGRAMELFKDWHDGSCGS